MKPVIAFAPLEVDGLMINLWLRDENSSSKIETNCIDDNKRFFPYKLILSLGQIAFIDGDVIHGGGITPSGKRCHIYMCSPDVYADKKNTHFKLDSNTAYTNDLLHLNIKPISDQSNYDQDWIEKQHNHQFAKPWKSASEEVKKELNRVNIIHTRPKNPSIDKLYAEDSNYPSFTTSGETKTCLVEQKKICHQNKLMGIECIDGKCCEKCNNCTMGKYKWKNVYVDKSNIHSFGLFADQQILKEEFIIDYLGLEYQKGKDNEKKFSNYIMQMKHHYIDGHKDGSLARYINHSNNPNAIFKKIVVEGVERSAVYTDKNIGVKEEITCNYM